MQQRNKEKVIRKENELNNPSNKVIFLVPTLIFRDGLRNNKNYNKTNFSTLWRTQHSAI